MANQGRKSEGGGSGKRTGSIPFQKLMVGGDSNFWHEEGTEGALHYPFSLYLGWAIAGDVYLYEVCSLGIYIRTRHATTATGYAVHGKESLIRSIKCKSVRRGPVMEPCWALGSCSSALPILYSTTSLCRGCGSMSTCPCWLVGWSVGRVGWGHVEMGVVAFPFLTRVAERREMLRFGSAGR
jgi:hypothetical protein